MAWVVLAASLVALVQAVAWLGPVEGEPRSWRGAALGVVGVIALGLSLVHLFLPAFFAT